MSNARKLRPRPPDEDEEAFRRELAAGCPHCGSKVIVAKFRGRWDFGLRCPGSCPTHRDQRLAHAVASAAAARAGLGYRAVDNSTGHVTGVVVARAGAG